MPGEPTAEAPRAPPPPKEAATPDDAPAEKEDITGMARRKKETETVVRIALNSRRFVDSDGKDRSPETPEEQSLHIYQRLSRGEIESASFPKDADGHDIVLPELEGVDSEGKPIKFGNNKVRIAGISGKTDEGQLICRFEDESGEVKDSKGDVLEMPLPRETVADAQLVAERDRIEGFFEGDQKKLIGAYIDSRPQVGKELPQTEETDTVIEGAARANGQFVTADLRDALLRVHGEEATRPEEVKKLLESLKGRTLQTREDFMMHVGLELKERNQALNAEIAKHEEALKVNPTDVIAQGELQKLKDEQKRIGDFYSKLQDPDSEETKATSEVYEKVQSGNIDPERAKFLVKAVREGDAASLISQIPDLQVTEDMSDEQRAEVEEKKKNLLLAIGKGAGKGGLSIAAILALLIGAVGYAAISGMAQSTRR